MSASNEPLASATKATIESLRTLADAALASAEQVLALNVRTARSAIEDGAAKAATLAAAKAPVDLVELQKSLAQPGLQKAVEYSRSLGEISASARGELAKAVEAYLATVQQQSGELLKSMAKQAPVGSDAALANLQTAFDIASSSFDSFKQFAKQLGEVAEANVAAANRAALAAADAASKVSPA